jgi:hypothetical protein
MVTVVVLLAILITPYIAATSLSTGSGRISPSISSETSLPKIDTQLQKLIDNQTRGNTKIIVVFKNEADKSLIEQMIKTDPSFKLITTFHIIPAALIEGPINKISKLFSINGIQEVYLNKKLTLDPINKTLSSKSSMSPSSSWIQAINITSVRAVTNGSGITVAVVDSGIYGSHPDLAGKVVKNASFVNKLYDYQLNENADDYFGHGTYVAGIIAGGGILTSAYEGVAPGVKLISAKCIDEYGEGFTAGIIEAIEWAVNQSCSVINLSIGGGAADPDDPISLAVDSAVSSGVVVVASAGNGGPDYSTGSSPAAARLAISVGASNGTKSIAFFSSRGPTLDGRAYPDVLAPGVDIVSTLAASSAIAEYAERFNLSSGNYVSLGGTSASAPLVSGSVALLLSSLTGLTSLPTGEPKVEIATAIRIALMHTANNSVGTDVNTYGSGIVNVGVAYTYLKQFSKSPYPIVEVYPKTLINPPALLGFLGDYFAMNLSLLTAYKANLTIDVNGNASQFIKLRNSTFTNVVGLTPINLNISIPVNATLGKYVAQIGFINESSSDLITGENVTVSFTVSSPTGRLYFDLFHTDSTFSIKSDLYKLALRLTNESYGVYEGDTPLTYTEISQYDILVLTDPQIMFGVEEIEAIHDFVAKNGSLLVLGNYYPGIAAEAVNDVTALYGIQFNKDFIANYTDIVTARILNSLINVTSLASHPVTTDVGSYLFGYGSSLSVNTSMATTLANTSVQWGDRSVLAAYDSSVTGRVIVSGSMLFATNGYLLNESIPGNAKLADNIVSWLLRDGNASVEVVTPKTRLKSGDGFQIGLLIVNRTDGNLLDWTANCTANNSSSTIQVHLNSSVNGIFYNTSLGFTSEGFYTLRVMANSSEKTILREFNLEVVNAAPEILNIDLETHYNTSVSYPLPTYFKGYLPSGTPIISRFGDYVDIIINASGVDSGSSITVYLTRFPDLYLSNNKSITYVTLEAKYNAITGLFHTQYKPTRGNSTDVYFFWVSANNTGHMSLSNQVGAIMVASIDPVINENTSTVNGQTISSLNQTYITINTGETVSVVLNGSDAEDSPRYMKAWAILLDYSLFRFPGFASAELILSNLTFDSATSTFNGNLSIPSSGFVRYATAEGVVNLSLVNRQFFLVLLLVDSDGAYSISAANVWITKQTQSPVALIFAILLISVAVPVLLIIFIERRTRKRLASSPQPDASSPISLSY